MPFKSKKQAAYLFAKQPAIAKEFASKTPNMKSLPMSSKPKRKKKAK
jgi:hypothetical protein